DGSGGEEGGDGEGYGDGGGGDRDRASPMRFVQLYTSPSFKNQRSKLVTPSEDWEQSHGDVSKHKFSPLICEAVRDGSGVVWANTAVEEGLLGRSDLPLRTAVGAPVYTQGRDFLVLVLFSPSIVQNSATTMEFLYTLAQASSDAANAFLPPSAFRIGPSLGPGPPGPALGSQQQQQMQQLQYLQQQQHRQPLAFPAHWWRNPQTRFRRLAAIRASLPRDVIFEILAMGQAPHPERSLRAVRSAYNDSRGGGGAGAVNGPIPSEFLRQTGGNDGANLPSNDDPNSTGRDR
ncbi:unnamed protein product, partial [Laminaria digitata]